MSQADLICKDSNKFTKPSESDSYKGKAPYVAVP